MKVIVAGDSAPARLLMRDLGEVAGLEAVWEASADNLASIVAGANVVIGCWDEVALEEQSAEAAVSVGAAYVSCSQSPEAFEALAAFEEKATGAGSVIVPAMSWTPGLTNLMVGLAASRLDAVRRVDISWIVSSAWHGATRALMQALKPLSGEVVVFEKGWRLASGGTLEEEVYFPPPLGWQTVRLAAGPEPLSIAHSIQGVEQVHLKGGVTGPLADSLARAAPANGQSLKSRAWLGLLAPLSHLRTSHESWSAARVDVEGEKDGLPQTLTYGVLDQLPNLLSAPVVTAAVMVGQGLARGNGVLAPETAFEPELFLTTLAQRGVRIASLDRSAVS